jgi:hypothetical protein
MNGFIDLLREKKLSEFNYSLLNEGLIKSLDYNFAIDKINDFIKLKKIGCNECQGDYLFVWNLEDWYHSSILSIFADKVVKENLDFYALNIKIPHLILI